jgi:hypothetical protein
MADKEPPSPPCQFTRWLVGCLADLHRGALGVNNIVNVQALMIIFKKGT